jgi:hypothetical protein
MEQTDEMFLLDLLNSTPDRRRCAARRIGHRAGGPGLAAGARAPRIDRRVAGRPRRALDPSDSGARAAIGQLAGSAARRRQLPPVGLGRRRELAPGCHCRSGGARAGRAGMGHTAPRPTWPAPAVREPGVCSVSDRSQQAEHGAVVLDGRLRKPDEGPPALRTHPHESQLGADARRRRRGWPTSACPRRPIGSSPWRTTLPFPDLCR